MSGDPNEQRQARCQESNRSNASCDVMCTHRALGRSQGSRHHRGKMPTDRSVNAAEWSRSAGPRPNYGIWHSRVDFFLSRDRAADRRSDCALRGPAPGTRSGSYFCDRDPDLHSLLRYFLAYILYIQGRIPMKGSFLLKNHPCLHFGPHHRHAKTDTLSLDSIHNTRLRR